MALHDILSTKLTETSLFEKVVFFMPLKIHKRKQQLWKRILFFKVLRGRNWWDFHQPSLTIAPSMKLRVHPCSSITPHCHDWERKKGAVLVAVRPEGSIGCQDTSPPSCSHRPFSFCDDPSSMQTKSDRNTLTLTAATPTGPCCVLDLKDCSANCSNFFHWD